MADEAPRTDRALVARCRRCDPEAYETVGYRYASGVYDALRRGVANVDQAHVLFREVFRRLGDTVHQVRRGRDLAPHVAATTGGVLADNLPDGVLQPVVITPANGEAGGTDPELGAAAAALMRTAAEQRLPVLLAERRRQVIQWLVVGGAATVAVGVLIMLFHSRLAVLDPRARAQRIALSLVREEVVATGLADSLRALGDDPLAAAAQPTEEERRLSEICLALEEIANADPRTAPAQLAYWRSRIEAGGLAASAAELAEQSAGAEREELLRASLVLEQITNL